MGETTTVERCPTCGSSKSGSPNTAASNCYNAWHRGDVVHLQREPLGTPGPRRDAACGAEVDDPPSQLTSDREFITCRQCRREIYARIADEAADALGILPGLGDLVRQGKLTPRESQPRAAIDEDEAWSDSVKIIRHHQELTDDEIDRTTLEGLRSAYRSLRDHHIAEIADLVQQLRTVTNRGPR